MALKAKYASQSEIPEALHGFYKQSGNEWVLDLEAGQEGHDPAATAAEQIKRFRQNNIELQKKLNEANAALEATKEAYGGTDPDAVKAILAKVNDQSEQELIRAGRLDELIARRTQSMQTSYQREKEAAAKKAADAEKALSATRDRYATTYLAEKLRKTIEAKKLRVHAPAMDDILRRGRDAFRLADDLETLEPIGTALGQDGNAPTLETWVDSLTQNAPHFFEASTGGGTTASKGGNGAGQRVLKRSDIPDDQYAAVLASGAKVVL